MPPQPPPSDLNILAIVGIAITAWYVYQIASRKKERIRYKIWRTLVALIVYVIATLILAQQGLPALEAAVLGALAGMGSAWLLIIRLGEIVGHHKLFDARL